MKLPKILINVDISGDDNAKKTKLSELAQNGEVYIKDAHLGKDY